MLKIPTQLQKCKTGKKLKDHVEVFNPGSRDQIGRRLISLGWKPDKFTETGKPMVDEVILDRLIKDCS